ncbi:MAG TPA: hypothetical protein VF762_21655 [Blastocatellia bacterium]
MYGIERGTEVCKYHATRNPKSRVAERLMRYENPKSKIVMPSKTLPINMARPVAFASPVSARKVIATVLRPYLDLVVNIGQA